MNTCSYSLSFTSTLLLVLVISIIVIDKTLKIVACISVTNVPPIGFVPRIDLVLLFPLLNFICFPKHRISNIIQLSNNNSDTLWNSYLECFWLLNLSLSQSFFVFPLLVFVFPLSPFFSPF